MAYVAVGLGPLRADSARVGLSSNCGAESLYVVRHTEIDLSAGQVCQDWTAGGRRAVPQTRLTLRAGPARG